MSTFHIIPSTEDQARFDALAAEYGGVWFTPAVRDAADGVEQFVLVADDGQWMGGFQLRKLKLKGVPALAVPLWHPHCGLFIKPAEGGTYALQTRNKRVMEAVATYLNTRSEKIISVPFPPVWIDMQPLIWSDFRCTIKYTYRLSLNETAEPSALFSAKTRNSVKKAEKDGVTVATSGSVDDLLQCVAKTADEKGFKLDDAALTRLVNALQPSSGTVFTAHSPKNELLAAALMVRDADTAYYLLGGVDRKQSSQGALNAVIAAGINWAKTAGCSVFDFEGSMLPEVERVFRGFGGDLTPFYVAAKAADWLTPVLRKRGRKEF